MRVEIKYGSNVQSFENKNSIVVGTDTDNDFFINDSIRLWGSSSYTLKDIRIM